MVRRRLRVGHPSLPCALPRSPSAHGNGLPDGRGGHRSFPPRTRRREGPVRGDGGRRPAAAAIACPRTPGRMRPGAAMGSAKPHATARGFPACEGTTAGRAGACSRRVSRRPCVAEPTPVRESGAQRLFALFNPAFSGRSHRRCTFWNGWIPMGSSSPRKRRADSSITRLSPRGVGEAYRKGDADPAFRRITWRDDAAPWPPR